MSAETPLLSQYSGLKREHPDEVLFFRLGDFYEMFNEDAVEVSRLLNLTLTHRADSPMCGIPYHAAKVYIARLLRLGKKIAIAEQIGEIAKKGLTERKVVEVITPGTALESEYLDGGSANFLACAYVLKDNVGFAYVDVTTGEFRATSFPCSSLAENLSKELGRANPRELILPESLRNNGDVNSCLEILGGIAVSWYQDWNFNSQTCYDRLVRQFKTANLKSFSLDVNSPEVPPAGFLLDYLEKNTNTLVPHIRSISVYSENQYVIMDDSSRRNLEILYNLRDGTPSFSLLECVNYTSTSMGYRLLRSWLSFPLTDLARIRERQSRVCFFFNDRALLKKVRDDLSGILDIERLAGRISLDKAHAKDLQALRQSLAMWKKVLAVLDGHSFSSVNMEDADKIIDLIQHSICDDPSTVFNEGRIIRENWSEDLDNWRNIQKNFSQILDEYLEEEKSKTGIANLKIKNSGNMGYFIEVTRGKLDKVPSHFIIRRSLVNADRYTTEKLQELESKLNESSSRIVELEHSLFLEIRNELKKYVSYLQKIAMEVAYADVVASFANAALVHSWVCPEMEESEIFQVEGARHPVVENHLPSGEFVPNDLILCGQDSDAQSFALITGPNMAGKSTFLRQNALISLLAQTGSFVPCSSARLGLVDRIFCRVGASDNLARGESTFLVEMTETARILRSATRKSLVIMDEVGRGTSTEDGLSIAWAVSEYLLNAIKCKTLFATHYHELTRMDHPSLKLLCMAVSQNGKNIVFLRKVVSGASENSYGIHVASLAGIPDQVLRRSEEILEKIQGEASRSHIQVSIDPIEVRSNKSSRPSFTGALFSDEELILNEILSCDTDNMTPIEALQSLSRWKKSLSGR